MKDVTKMQLAMASKDKVEFLLTKFLSGRNKCTIEAYSRDLDDFREFTHVADLPSCIRSFFGLSAGDANALVLSYRNHLFEQDLATSTINRRLAAIRSLVKLGRTFGAVSWEIEISNLKSDGPYRDTRGPGEAFQDMLAQVEGRRRPKLIRDYAILRLLHDLALRASEISRLDLEDVNLSGNTVAVLGKGRTQKTFLTIPAQTKDALEKWIEARGTQPGPLFTNFDRARKGHRLTRVGLYQMVRRLGAQLGIKVWPHGIRHTAVTTAIKVAQKNEITINEVLQFSRHKNLATLQVYADKIRDVQGQIASLVADTTPSKSNK